MPPSDDPDGLPSDNRLGIGWSEWVDLDSGRRTYHAGPFITESNAAVHTR
jgi:hypothetical protein